MRTPFNTKNQTAMQAMSGAESNSEVALNKICVRYINKYINDFDEAKSLKESIKTEGLIEPITVNSITKYIEKSSKENPISSDEKKYYEQMLEEGKEYFITTGHRRFYAFCSLCIGEDVHTKEDLQKFYKKFESILQKSIEAEENFDYENINNYTSIKCFIVDDDATKEVNRYNASNLNQRITKDFEIVDNTIDEMKRVGEWEKVIKNNQNTRVDSMTDRAVFDTIKRLDIKIKDIKNVDEAKKTLKEIEPEKLPGYYSDLNKSISEYIKVKKSKNVSTQSIDKIRKILATFDKPYVDAIYNGALDYKKAIEIQTYYNELNESEKKDILKKIKNKTFDYKVEKEKHQKQKKVEKVSMSQKDWIDIVKKLLVASDKDKEEIKKHLIKMGFNEIK